MVAFASKQLAGFRFRRQHPLGSYIVDFFCADARLIVEADGGQHSDDNAHDAARTAWLEARGYHVLRFWNSDVLSQTEEVLAAILEALRARRPSLPSPSRGRGRLANPA